MTTNQLTTSAAREEGQEIMWDCSSGIYPIEETVSAPISFEQALRNLPRNDDGESFYADLKEDADRMKAIRGGDESYIESHQQECPWLTRQNIINTLERSEKTLLDAGFVI